MTRVGFLLFVAFNLIIDTMVVGEAVAGPGTLRIVTAVGVVLISSTALALGEQSIKGQP